MILFVKLAVDYKQKSGSGKNGEMILWYQHLNTKLLTQFRSPWV